MARMVTPYLFIEVLLLPSILEICKHTHTKYILLLVFLIYGLMKLNSGLSAYPEVFIPYRSIFD
jgi:hypothetical protein